MGFNVSDLNRLSADLGKGSRMVGKMAQVVVRKTAKDIEGNAKQIVPVDTAFLKNSIGTSDLRTVGTSGTLSVEIGPTASYGKFVEFGTSTQAPQAYLGPSLDRFSGPFEQAMGQLAERAINGG